MLKYSTASYFPLLMLLKNILVKYMTIIKLSHYHHSHYCQYHHPCYYYNFYRYRYHHHFYLYRYHHHYENIIISNTIIITNTILNHYHHYYNLFLTMITIIIDNSNSTIIINIITLLFLISLPIL